MSKKYFRWKNADCNGQNIEWEEMTGSDFFRFFNSDKRKGRYFIILNNDICKEADIIFIEATKEQYNDWYKEFCHHRYINRYLPEGGILSLDCPVDEEDGIYLHDLAADLYAEDVAEQIMQSMLVEYIPYALNRLSSTYREAIVLKYFDFPTATDAEIAERLGISENAFFKRRKLGLLTLKNFFEN